MANTVLNIRYLPLNTPIILPRLHTHPSIPIPNKRGPRKKSPETSFPKASPGSRPMREEEPLYLISPGWCQGGIYNSPLHDFALVDVPTHFQGKLDTVPSAQKSRTIDHGRQFCRFQEGCQVYNESTYSKKNFSGNNPHGLSKRKYNLRRKTITSRSVENLDVGTNLHKIFVSSKFSN